MCCARCATFWPCHRAVHPHCCRKNWGEDGYGKIEMTEDGTYGACNMYYFMVAPTSIVPSVVDVVAEPAPCELLPAAKAEPGLADALHLTCAYRVYRVQLLPVWCHGYHC